MNKNNMIKIENYFEVFLLILLISSFLLLIKSFIFPLLFAATFVFLSYNIYEKLLSKIKNENLAASLILFAILIIILLPIYLFSMKPYQSVLEFRPNWTWSSLLSA